MRGPLERRSAEVQGDRSTAVDEQVEPAVVSREGEPLERGRGRHPHPDQSGSEGGDHSTSDNRRPTGIACDHICN